MPTTKFPQKHQRVFLKTASGYTDPSPWSVEDVSDVGVTCISADKKRVKVMTFAEFNAQANIKSVK
jgi:hypothetical protein